ncbi:MAG: hypothetical protein IJW29_09320 [Clostridia bacterium]|nr:hypothetical protein [Clostridia bacterium]MBQ9785690.1 hypothetical protein [Clostridia bacterium]
MNWKRLGKALLYPHIAVMIALLPVSTVLLVGAMVFVGTESVVAYVSYVLAAYTLTVWCFKTPYLIRFFKTFKDENKYARRWLDDERLRVNVSLYGSLAWNVVYAVFQLWLGFYHGSFWFYSMAGYYVSLAVMRFFLVRYTTKNRPGEHLRAELVRYRACGWIFLVMNLALSLMVFFMIYWNRTFHHHQITTIALAAYTFTSFTTAIIGIVKYRKYQSPVYSATKAIGLAAACVSMLTLTSTMLTAFGDGTMGLLERRIMLGAVGGSVTVFIIAMAIYMLVHANRQMKEIKENERGA